MAVLKPRTIKLHCPSTSEVTVMAVRDDERVDFGFIARAFGLEPKTVKLNAHFISRDKDFVASSVTWKSLLSFFASKGLSASEIIVDGKLARVGVKRACESWDSVNGTSLLNSGQSTMEDHPHMVKKKKLRNGDSGCKRKQEHEDLSSLRRLSINETNTYTFGKSNNGKVNHTGFSTNIPPNSINGVSKIILSTSVCCKRLREDNTDEALLTSQCKRVR